MQLSWVMAPVIGGLIGLITNSLAIKMLFRPHRAIYIGKLHIPFTPGLIPKEKQRIANAIGEVISKYLLDDITIKKAICDEKIKEKACQYIHQLVERMKQVKISIKELADQKNLANQLDYVKINIRDSFCEYVITAVTEGDLIDDLIQSAVISVQNEMNPLVAKLVKNPLEAAKPQIVNNAKEIIRTRGQFMMEDYIDRKYDEFMDKKICDLAYLIEEREEEIVAIVWDKYISFIEKKSQSMIRELNLQQIVEEKINGYDVNQLEQIILSISKKELNALVWLGGLLGMLMGFVNLLF